MTEATLVTFSRILSLHFIIFWATSQHRYKQLTEATTVKVAAMM